MRRIVMGHDGSPVAAAALRWAVGFASMTGADLVIATAYGPSGLDQTDAVTTLCNALADARHTAAVDPRTKVRFGSAAQVLCRLAVAEHADLLVVGTRGTGGFAGLHIGSVAHHVVHHTKVPVAVVPAGATVRPLNTVVVGVDGSDGSAAAVDWVAEAFAGQPTRIVAVHAREPFLEWVPELSVAGWRRQAERDAARWVKPLADSDHEVRVVVDRDINPAAALVRAAEADDAGLVVVGARGIGGFTELRLGRVPLQLIHHVDRPVVIVPAITTEAMLP